MSRRLRLFFVALAAAGLAARLSLIADKVTLEHDDAISYLAATGHQGDYARMMADGAYPYGAWAAARDWQQFIQPDGAPSGVLIFGRIRADLARYDVHPPLYFWLLHLWTRAAGTGIRAGAWLNLGIDALTALALYRLALAGRRDHARAWAVVALWGLSSIALKTMLPVRQYALFTLWAVVYAGAVARGGPWWRNDPACSAGAYRHTPLVLIRSAAIPLILAGAAGLLTHYAFVLVLLAGGLVIVQRRDRAGLARGGIAAAVAAAVAVAVAVLLALALHPDFFDPVRRETGDSAAPLGERVTVVIGALAALSIPLAFGLLPPALAAVVVRSHAIERRRAAGGYVGGGAKTGAGPGIAGLFILALLAGQIVLYLLQVSPAHTLTDDRYLGPVWPFVALAMAGMLDGRAFERLGAGRWVLAGLGMLALAGIVARPPDAVPSARPEPGTRVLIDNPAEGVLLPLVIHLDPDTPVFAARQADLLAAPDRWLAALRADGGLYSSLPAYAATEQGRAAILAQIGPGAGPAPARYVWQADFHREAEQVYRIAPEP